MRHFGAVGWQPTALKSNHGVLKHQGILEGNQLDLMHFGAVGWQPTALKSNHGLETQGFGGNLRHFGAVGGNLQHLKATMGS